MFWYLEILQIVHKRHKPKKTTEQVDGRTESYTYVYRTMISAAL